MINKQGCSILYNTVLQILAHEGAKTPFVVVSDAVTRSEYLHEAIQAIRDEDSSISVRSDNDRLIISYDKCEVSDIDDVLTDVLFHSPRIIDYVDSIAVLVTCEDDFNLSERLSDLHKKRVIGGYYSTRAYKHCIIVNGKSITLDVYAVDGGTYLVLQNV